LILWKSFVFFWQDILVLKTPIIPKGYMVKYLLSPS
jgi:hypothetical protein